MAVYRVYVEKKSEYAVYASELLYEIHTVLGISSVSSVRVLKRYDIEGITEQIFLESIKTVFSEPQVDNIFTSIPAGDVVFAAELVQDQFDQCAESAAACIAMAFGGEYPTVKCATVFLLTGAMTGQEVKRVQEYVMNPAEVRKAQLALQQTLTVSTLQPTDIAVLRGFCELNVPALKEVAARLELAMDEGDIIFCQEYFRSIKREPTITEIRVLDHYWAESSRHTTFGTILDHVTITDVKVKHAYDRYLKLRADVHAGKYKPLCFADIVTIGAKYLKKQGLFSHLDDIEYQNTSRIRIDVDCGGVIEPWLLFFQNEARYCQVECEPFAGAASCISNAIQGSLANGGYVYQAMRLTGEGDPLMPVQDTLLGKLPQRTLAVKSAKGYANYVNTAGVATGLSEEWYHPGYQAKRMEIGVVLGAAAQDNVQREAPEPGDVVVLIGARTAKDVGVYTAGCAKLHQTQNLENGAVSVQRGNPMIERSLQRLMRQKKAVRLIKRSRAVSAGGLAVAVGELADGVEINLNAILQKFDGMDGTELAISETGERIAVVVQAKDAQELMVLANSENLHACIIAKITEAPRLVMHWNGKIICDIAREFLDSNGAKKHASAVITPSCALQPLRSGETLLERFENLMSDLNVCSKKGFVQQCDATVGAGTVLMPFGGKTQTTPSQIMVSKLPVLKGETKTCSAMAYGFNPFIGEQSAYAGGYLSVVESVSKLVAGGFAPDQVYLRFQQYFASLGQDPVRWGKPLSALLGALDAQLALYIPAVGGKDAMCGSFESFHVPPSFASFAVAVGQAQDVISNEFKMTGSKIVWLRPEYEEDGILPKQESLRALLHQVSGLIRNGKVLAAYTPGYGGVAEALFKMGLGNRIGVALDNDINPDCLFEYAYGSFVLELIDEMCVGVRLGNTISRYIFACKGEEIALSQVREKYENKLESIVPNHASKQEKGQEVPAVRFEVKQRAYTTSGRVAVPQVLIPVFPGTNGEYEAAAAMERAGAHAEVMTIQYLTPDSILQSMQAMVKKIEQSQMILLAGGFSGADEPDGSAKLMTAFFRNPVVKEAVQRFLQQKDGLMLGIGNGFQALIKLGLLPYGDIIEPMQDSPVLTWNTIGRHQSMLVRTRIASNQSPWLRHMSVDEIHTVAVSNAQGRLTANNNYLQEWAEYGQIATQYVDLTGMPTMDVRYNPSSSVMAIEGLTSKDGRILGKMGHSERSGLDLYKNIEGNKWQNLFRGGVDYFRI